MLGTSLCGYGAGTEGRNVVLPFFLDGNPVGRYIAALQSAVGAPVTGTWDPETRGKLLSLWYQENPPETLDYTNWLDMAVNKITNPQDQSTFAAFKPMYEALGLPTTTIQDMRMYVESEGNIAAYRSALAQVKEAIAAAEQALVPAEASGTALATTDNSVWLWVLGAAVVVAVGYYIWKRNQ